MMEKMVMRREIRQGKKAGKEKIWKHHFTKIEPGNPIINLLAFPRVHFLPSWNSVLSHFISNHSFLDALEFILTSFKLLCLLLEETNLEKGIIRKIACKIEKQKFSKQYLKKES